MQCSVQRSTRKRTRHGIGGTFLALALIGGSAASATAQVEVGSDAPDIQVGEWFNHEKVALPSLRGRVVAYTFVRVEDTECLYWLEVWEKLRQEFALQPVTFLAITNEPPAKVKDAIEVEEIRAAILTDPGDAAPRAFGVQIFPSVAVVDTRGKVAYNGKVDAPQQMRDAINESLRFARPFPKMPKSGKAVTRFLDKWQLDKALPAVDKALKNKRISDADRQLLGDTRSLITQLGQDLHSAAQRAIKDEDWPLAVTALTRLTSEHKGSEPAAAAATLLAELKARTEVQEEVNASIQYAKGERFERDKNWKQAHRTYVSLAKQFPETQAGKKGAGLAEFLKGRAN